MKLHNQSFNIQGISAIEICKKFDTPLYVYDSETIEKQINDFRKAFEGTNLKIKFAIKSCSNICIAKLMKKLGTGLDTVSIPEIQMGLKAGFQPNEIVFTPNIVEFEEIKKAVKFGTYINIENLQNLEKFGKEYGNSVPCCLRLNPNIISEVENGEVSGIDFSNINTKFWADRQAYGLSRKGINRFYWRNRCRKIYTHRCHYLFSRKTY